MSKKYIVITDSDLDGVTCYLTFKWFHPGAHIEVYPTSVTRFRNDYTNLLSKKHLSDYDKVYIFDLDVGEHKDIIDNKNHFIIDHHKTHVDAGQYANATAIVKEQSSACIMVYKTFKALYETDLTPEQKKLIVIANDYDSYTLSLAESKKLNTLYWNQNNRFQTFCRQFNNGFFGFNIQQENTIKLYKDKLDDIIKNLKIFYLDTPIQNIDTKILATFATDAINDVADTLLNEYNADIAIVVNLDTKKASFRRNTSCKHINLINLVNKFCGGEGGGHEYAAGGVVNQTFLEFTKLLKPYGN